MSLYNELPRTKQQTVLKKVRPDSKFSVYDYGEYVKIVLIVPDAYRGFIYLNKNKTITEGQEQLATDFLIGIR